jgi:hypothetical protein
MEYFDSRFAFTALKKCGKNKQLVRNFLVPLDRLQISEEV